MFYIVSRLITDDEAAGIVNPDAETCVRVVDVDSGNTTDYPISELTKFVKDGIIDLENAEIDGSGKLIMVNGDLSNYGTIIARGSDEPAEVINLKPVALAELTEGDKTVGFWFASSDGELFEYTIDEAVDCVRSYGCANGELNVNNGEVHIICSQKPLPVFEADMDDEDTAEETAESFTPFMEKDVPVEEGASSAPVGVLEDKSAALPEPEEKPESVSETEEEPETTSVKIKPATELTAEDKLWEVTVFMGGKRDTFKFPIEETTENFKKFGVNGVSVMLKKGIYVACIEEAMANGTVLELKFPNCIDIVGTSFCEGWGSLTSVTLGRNTAIIMPGAFSSCTNLDSVRGMESVRYIDNMAFCGCKRLMTSGNSEFKLGDELEVIGYGAFLNCTGFQSMILPDSVKTVKSFAFCGMTNLVNVHVPIGVLKHWAGCQKTYVKAVETKTLTSDTVDCIGVFKGCEKLTSINISKKDIGVFGDFIFKGCTSLNN